MREKDKNIKAYNRIKINKYQVFSIVGYIFIFISSLLLIISAIVKSDYNFTKSTLGDINGDGVVSIADVNYILSCSAGIDSTATNNIISKADADGDGKITFADARIAEKSVKQYVTIIDEQITEPETTPLVDNSSLTATDANGVSTQVLNDPASAFNAISNEKMYIYPDLTEVMQLKNTFVIISFGWGHGVGMSQHGAVGLARAGYSYIQIIQHYYNGVIIVKESYPKTVSCAGRSVDTVEMLARIIQQEISGITKRNDSLDINALRAQAVAAYTNMKFSGYSVSGCSYVNSYSQCRDDVKQAAQEIAGQFIQYNGNVVYAYYSACSAGVTATYNEIWGDSSRDMRYLGNSASYYDCYTPDYISATAFSEGSVKNYINEYDPSILLSSNPEEWLQIITHDDAVNENIGYVSAMRIGDRTFSSGAGMKFRDKVMQYDIDSPCFTIIYNGKYK